MVSRSLILIFVCICYYYAIIYRLRMYYLDSRVYYLDYIMLKFGKISEVNHVYIGSYNETFQLVPKMDKWNLNIYILNLKIEAVMGRKFSKNK